MDWSDRVPGLLARLSTVLSIIGGLTTAALGPAFIWRFALHHRPGERIGLWFGFLAAALLAGALRPWVVGGVRVWRRSPGRGWPLQGIAGLIVFVLVGPRSPAPLLLLGALLALLDSPAARTPAPPEPWTP